MFFVVNSFRSLENNGEFQENNLLGKPFPSKAVKIVKIGGWGAAKIVSTCLNTPPPHCK